MEHKFKNGIYRHTLKAKASKLKVTDLRYKDHFKIDRSTWKPKADNAVKTDNPFDQGQLGSCTANSIAKHVKYVCSLAYDPSRLYIYYNERAIEGSINDDSGAELTDGMTVVKTLGVIPETEWAYDVTQFTVKPPQKLYEEGQKELVHNCYRVDDLDDLYQTLSDGFYVSLGFTCYESFETQPVADTGFLPMPGAYEEQIGGHAVLAVGYGKAKDFLAADVIAKIGISPDLDVIKILNSWGKDWGLNGYFLMPIDYFNADGLVTDMWTIRKN